MDAQSSLFPLKAEQHEERILFFCFVGAVYFAYLLFVLYRRAKGGTFVTPKLVCTEISIAPEDPMAMLRLRGERRGVLGWLARAAGFVVAYEMHVSSKLITLKTPSAFSEGHIVIPVNRVTAVSGRYHVPLGYIFHWAAAGAVLNLWHGGVTIVFMSFLGYVHALANSSMRLAVSSGEGFFGFHYVVGERMTKELVFRTLETLRILLVRTQDNIPMPLLPPPMMAPAPPPMMALTPMAMPMPPMTAPQPLPMMVAVPQPQPLMNPAPPAAPPTALLPAAAPPAANAPAG